MKKLKTLPSGEHIPVRQYMLAFALKSIVRVSFGDGFKSDKEILKFEKAYDVVSIMYASLYFHVRRDIRNFMNVFL